MRGLLRKDIYAQTGAATVEAFQFMSARCDRMVSAVLERIQSLETDALNTLENKLIDKDQTSKPRRGVIR